MKIGVFYPNNYPLSARNYIDNILAELHKKNIECNVFNEKESIPDDVDLYWDPRSMGGIAPYIKLAGVDKPLVVTVHGASSFALPLWEHYSTIKSALKARQTNKTKLKNWLEFRKKGETYISVSEFGKQEISRCLSLDENKITPIWHGVDLELFTPTSNNKAEDRYFLHVSQYQPLKNVKRIIKAYKKLSSLDKPKLILVAVGYTEADSSLPEGVQVIRKPIQQIELANLYRGATALVNCSLRESFGMTILEAMACGCPVITSNVSALPEVAGNAALLVNPRSVREISKTMKQLINNETLRSDLSEKGLLRVKQFTWGNSAKKHIEVFRKAIQ